MNTNKSKHTPGPWRVDCLANDPKTYGDKSGLPIVIDSCNDEICSVVWDGISNARLIAAAPELLAALEAIYEANEKMARSIDPGNMLPILNSARTAIAKAKETL